MDVDDICVWRRRFQRRTKAGGAPVPRRPRERKVPHANVLVLHTLGSGRQRPIAIRRRRKHLDIDTGGTERAAESEDAPRRAAVPERRREIWSDMKHTHDVDYFESG